MSRSNPYKKKRRAAKETTLIYGEGLAEEIFLKYLRKLYAINSGVAVTIRKGKGGSADSIVMKAAQIFGDFDQRIVVLDNDKSKAEMKKANQLAKYHGMSLIKNTPCLEALLLSMLNNGKSFSNKSSQWCKKEFENKYISKKKRGDMGEYEKLFPKMFLEKMRGKVLGLGEYILVMEGNM